jgi:phosphoribosylformimino-5-aminoimidazole carboxamide ribotide isomerase
MLIPSIDLQDGKVVQLVQGERLAIASADVFAWVERFDRFPLVQLIDLDAAMGLGDNLALVKTIAGRLACQVGGGIRTIRRADDLLAAGARRVIVGTALYSESGAEIARAAEFAAAIGVDRLIGAVDSRAGRVVVKGWKASVDLSAVDAVRAFEPYCGGFLYTHIDTEGLMGGIDLDAVMTVRRATTRRLAAAGGITTQTEIDRLHAAGIDAVVGMAIYTGTLPIDAPD